MKVMCSASSEESCRDLDKAGVTVSGVKNTDCGDLQMLLLLDLNYKSSLHTHCSIFFTAFSLQYLWV